MDRDDPGPWMRTADSGPEPHARDFHIPDIGQLRRQFFRGIDSPVIVPVFHVKDTAIPNLDSNLTDIPNAIVPDLFQAAAYSSFTGRWNP